jgi:HlyD family secretion protein
VRRTPLVAVLAAAGLTLAAAACEPSTAGITTDTVRRATVNEIVDAPASVTARAVATLTASADGTLTKLAVEPGATVKVGAVVAVIDSPSARKRLADAKAALNATSRSGRGIRHVDLSGAQSSVDKAAAGAFAAARSAAQQVADDQVREALLAQVDAAHTHYESAARTSRALVRQVQRGIASIGDAVAALGAAQRAQAEAAYDLAKSTVDALTLRAPIAGVVQFARPAPSVSADPLAGLLGSVSAGGVPPGAVAAGGAPTGGGAGTVAGVDDVLAVGDHIGTGAAVVTIVDVSEIGLAGEVDETDVLLVSPGVTGSVELDAAPGIRYEATVRTVDLLPSPSARGGVAYRIRLSFGNARSADGHQAPPRPRPGMSAVAHLRVRTATDAVAVPAAAVFTTNLGDTVWVMRDRRAARQSVHVGVQGEDLVQILSGLEPGERIVVSGTDRVSAGQEL